LNDVFTQVVEAARRMGMGKLGRVAIDSTRVAANASRIVGPPRSLAAERARISAAHSALAETMRSR